MWESYGKKADKNIKVTAKKSGSYGKKVRFKNLNYSEKATKTLNCVHKIKIFKIFSKKYLTLCTQSVIFKI